ncbi:MAG: HEPN domain-containing protein [Kiritimatiellia bacterium]
MASKARKAFDENMVDVENLIQYYEFADESFREAAIEPPPGADVVLRSAIVLLVTYWEAYIEDIVSEGVAHLVEHVPDPNNLPKELLKAIARELKTDKNEIAIWRLASDGWRELLTQRLPGFRERRNRSFNTPKSDQTRQFVCEALGISDITLCWKIDKDEPAQTCKVLDKVVELRGQIAHRGKLSKTVKPEVVRSMTEWFKKLVSKTGGHINSFIKKSCGVPLWETTSK